jgi:hypothetical protein
MFCPLSFLEKMRVGPLFPIVEKNKKDLTLQGSHGKARLRERPAVGFGGHAARDGNSRQQGDGTIGDPFFFVGLNLISGGPLLYTSITLRAKSGLVA